MNRPVAMIIPITTRVPCAYVGIENMPRAAEAAKRLLNEYPTQLVAAATADSHLCFIVRGNNQATIAHFAYQIITEFLKCPEPRTAPPAQPAHALTFLSACQPTHEGFILFIKMADRV